MGECHRESQVEGWKSEYREQSGLDLNVQVQ